MLLPSAIAVAIILGSLALMVQLGRRRFRSQVAADLERLLSGPTSALGPPRQSSRCHTLPEPVRRYLEFAVPPNAAAIRTAHLTHAGFFRTRPEQRWFPIRGEEYFTVAAPGFVWNATMRLAPLLWIEARDCLLSGRGHMLVKFNSTFTIANARGPQIDQAALLRWLGETIWFPPALAAACIEWEPVNATTARATIRDAPQPVTATFEFDPDGKLLCVRADRYRDTGGGHAVLTPWIAQCGDYQEFHGLRVPASAEVIWQLETGDFSYARFQVTAFEYTH